MTGHATLQKLAEQVRASGVLGRSRLLRLFNFLVDCSATGTIPKEIVIAADVFNKTTGFDVSQDSIVRVYIHNLRRKLQEFYHAGGKHEPLQLVLPKGEYRLVVVAKEVSLADDAATLDDNVRRRAWIAWSVAGFALLLNAVFAAYFVVSHVEAPYRAVRGNPVWSRLLNNDKPIVIVLGDYYIFGDTHKTLDVTRLIREFSINSKSDLEHYLQANPNLADDFLDVGLGYLPTSSGEALADIMPVLAAADRRRLRVVLMSSLDANTLKSANIVYIGLLSGLGSLKDVVFGASRFQIGDSFDELIDRNTHRHYVSGANQYAGEHKAFGGGVGYRDYALFSTFAGPDDNQIIIIAGTQDEGLRQMAEASTDRSRLDELVHLEAGHSNFEALFEVLSRDNLNLDGKLLVAAPLNPSSIWSSR